MSAYIVHTYNILDRSRIDELGPISLPVVEKYGGEISIASFVKNLENASFSHMVVYKFPNMAAAESYYESEENRKIAELRNELIEGSIVLVPGFDSNT
ncbi:MAG: DUF1330 domain-containing protein [Cyanobacteria bacterium P01_A01_bin.15]